MRIAISIIFTVLIAALIACSILAKRSRKSLGHSVALLVASLIVPVIGNLMIISSDVQALSVVGCYIYFIGMDLTMFALMRFTSDYCRVFFPNKPIKYSVYALLGADALQLFINIFTGHAFSTEAVEVDGALYYRVVPYLGQTIHRVVDYGILAAVLIIFIVKIIRTPRISSERYIVILVVIVVTGIWESFYIFSRTPVDRSMIGFGVFGLLVYYFSLHYKSVLLLDRMLAALASKMPEALFFFDTGGVCFWANEPAIKLTGIENDNFETAQTHLKELFENFEDSGNEWTQTHLAGRGDDVKSYVLEKHAVTDAKNRTVGSFISVRDNTAEQQLLEREIYNATHDSLTGVYNRAGYNLLLSDMHLDKTFLLLIDADHFKEINDTHGHEIGDRILVKVTSTIHKHFRDNDCLCRIGGDEFVLLIPLIEELNATIGDRVRSINEELASDEDGLPGISVSAGGARGDLAKDKEQLFEHADKALYVTKRNGRKGYTLYSE